MPLGDLERELIEFMGGMRAEVANLKTGLESQGARIGALESRVTHHLESRTLNSNGWRMKATYSSGGAVLLGLLELVRHWISE